MQFVNRNNLMENGQEEKVMTVKVMLTYSKINKKKIKILLEMKMKIIKKKMY